MPKLPALKAREVARALERAGFQLVLQQGSHAQFKRGSLLVTVPMHSGDLNPNTLRSILRQAKMSIDELRELM
ncbi:MAG: addiction module toxin, HicA family [Chloroflexi bacterium]|nr:MAG: addiction module toxin, HicA family [Chloroflexota bacterium]